MLRCLVWLEWTINRAILRDHSFMTGSPNHSLTSFCQPSLFLKQDIWDVSVSRHSLYLCEYSPLRVDMFLFLFSAAGHMCFPFLFCLLVGGGFAFLFWRVLSKVSSGNNCMQASHKRPSKVCDGSGAWRNGSNAWRFGLHFTLVCFSNSEVSFLHTFWQSKKWNWLFSF